MRTRSGRLTETVLELLIAQVKTVWGSRKFIVFLLSLDILEAFDIVNLIKLLDILRKKGLPGWVVHWIRAFITNKRTTLVIQDSEIKAFLVPAKVLQRSPLSLILFLFYNSEFLDICQYPKEGLSTIGFADNINILAYNRSIENNYQILEVEYTRCLD